jgi:broad specificity phosphatase PhoE
MKLSKTILLIRHGTTDFNKNNILQGRTDNGLNETGEKEAQLLAEYLKEEKIDAIYHSPLKRARQTSEKINRYHHVEYKVINSFSEIDLGDWEGENYEDIVERNKKFHQKWLADADIQIPGGESFNQVLDRIKPGITEILKSTYENIIIVGHATVNRAILGELLKMDPGIARKFRMKNCAISKILVFTNAADYHTVLESWNITEHLNRIK